MLESIKRLISDFVDDHGISIEIAFIVLLIIASLDLIREYRNQSKLEKIPKQYKTALNMKIITLVLLSTGFIIVLIK